VNAVAANLGIFTRLRLEGEGLLDQHVPSRVMVGAPCRAGCALLLTLGCAAAPSRVQPASSEAERQLAWLERPPPRDLRSYPPTNVLRADPVVVPATVFVDDPGTSPRRELLYELGRRRAERWVVALTAEGSGATTLVPTRPYQVASFVAHVSHMSHAGWRVTSIDGETPSGIPDELALGFDRRGTYHPGISGEYWPHDARATLVLHAVGHCLRSLVEPLPAEAVGEGATWHGEKQVSDWGLPGTLATRYLLRTAGMGHVSVVATGKASAQPASAAPPRDLGHDESYDLSQETTLTRESEVRLDSAVAEGHQTEIVKVRAMQEQASAFVPLDAEFTLECRVRREP
jgi:hypothetical protein